MTSPHRPQGILPPHILERLAASGETGAARAAERTLVRERLLRGRREVRGAHNRGSGDNAGGDTGEDGDDGAAQGASPSYSLIPDDLRRRAATRPTVAGRAAAADEAAPRRSVHDAQQGTRLPGTLVRDEGAGPVSDESANEAYDGLGSTFAMFWEAVRRDSLDDRGLSLVGTVHYDEEFDNAFWDGEQMVFGDGDGEYFRSFTDCLDVIGHELTHGLTQYTAGLVYLAQAGALNESVSDVFGSLVRQWAAGETADQADWLIGKGLFTEKVHGAALRSMREPGTAYDDPVLGKDPQPGHLRDYQDLPHDDRHDNGGVHINSGIPNRAFYLAATGIGGRAWEGAGLVWYDVLTGGVLPKDADFAGFAAATVAATQKRWPDDADKVAAVREAWAEVGVTPKPAGARRSAGRQAHS